MQLYFQNTFLRPSVTVPATTATLVCPAISLDPAYTGPRTRVVVQIPAQNISGTVFLLVVNTGITPSAADIQNYGLGFTATDKVAELNCSENQALWAYSTAGQTLYPVERF